MISSCQVSPHKKYEPYNSSSLRRHVQGGASEINSLPLISGLWETLVYYRVSHCSCGSRFTAPFLKYISRLRVLLCGFCLLAWHAQCHPYLPTLDLTMRITLNNRIWGEGTVARPEQRLMKISHVHFPGTVVFCHGNTALSNGRSFSLSPNARRHTAKPIQV